MIGIIISENDDNCGPPLTWDTYNSGMSKRAGGGNATVTRGPCVGYLHETIEEIKSYKPEVKASKSDKWLQSYGHSKFCMFSY